MEEKLRHARLQLNQRTFEYGIWGLKSSVAKFFFFLKYILVTISYPAILVSELVLLRSQCESKGFRGSNILCKAYKVLKNNTGKKAAENRRELGLGNVFNFSISSSPELSENHFEYLINDLV